MLLMLQVAAFVLLLSFNITLENLLKLEIMKMMLIVNKYNKITSYLTAQMQTSYPLRP